MGLCFLSRLDYQLDARRVLGTPQLGRAFETALYMGPCQGSLAKGGKGLRLGAPKGARAAVAMEGRRGRGNGGFP